MIVKHIETGKRAAAIAQVARLFDEWGAGKAGVDKWAVYGAAFDLMDQGHITLLRIQDIAMEIGIKPSMIASRRSDWIVPAD